MNTKRYALLDSLRGLVLISMIAFHTAWDMVYMFNVDWSWYKSEMAYVWQQSICWSFILLSGFCWSFGKNKWKRGIVVFVAGAIVTIVTLIFMPRDRVVFGVLTFLGTAMLLMIPLDKVLHRCKPVVGLIISFGLFVLTRNVNDGWLGFESWRLVKLPGEWYTGWIATFLGFTEDTFFSTDYFSVFPWLFLFITGYFLHKLLEEKNGMELLMHGKCTPLETLGKNSLLIYMLHQPIIYGVLCLIHICSK